MSQCTQMRSVLTSKEQACCLSSEAPLRPSEPSYLRVCAELSQRHKTVQIHRPVTNSFLKPRKPPFKLAVADCCPWLRWVSTLIFLLFSFFSFLLEGSGVRSGWRNFCFVLRQSITYSKLAMNFPYSCVRTIVYF